MLSSPVVESGIEAGEGIDCWDVDGIDGVDGKDCLDGDGIDGVEGSDRCEGDGVDGLDDDGDWVEGLGGLLCDGDCGVEGRLGVDCDVQPKLSATAVRARLKKKLRMQLWSTCFSFTRGR